MIVICARQRVVTITVSIALCSNVADVSDVYMYERTVLLACLFTSPVLVYVLDFVLVYVLDFVLVSDFCI